MRTYTHKHFYIINPSYNNSHGSPYIDISPKLGMAATLLFFLSLFLEESPEH